MTSQEKAIELLNKCYCIGIDTGDCEIYEMPEITAKQCAIIAVDEIIDMWQNISDLKSTIVIDDKVSNIIDMVYYWQQVKTEIKKL